MTKSVYLFLILIFLTSSNVFAQFTANVDGAWNSCITWNTCGNPIADQIPDATDNVTIPANRTVTISSDAEANNITLENAMGSGGSLIMNGTFVFNVLGDLNLEARASFDVNGANSIVNISSDLILGNNAEVIIDGGSVVTVGGNLDYGNNGSNIDVDGGAGGGTLNVEGCPLGAGGAIRDPTGGRPVDETNLSFCASCPTGAQYGAGCGNITPPTTCAIPTIPVDPSCPVGADGYNEIEDAGVADNENINTNFQQYYIDDTGGTIEQISVSGTGTTIIICENISIVNLSISGEIDIFIRSGVNVTITNMAVSGELNLINYGNVIFDGAGGVTLGGANEIDILNATSSSLLDFQNQLNIAGTNKKIYAVAGSTIEVGTLDINPNLDEDIFILGNEATLDVTTYNSNNQINPVCATSSCALVNINTVGGGFTQDLSDQAEVSVCSVNGSANLEPGSASVTPTCPAICSSKLPVTLIGFIAEKQRNLVELTWSTAAEYNNDYFVIERSKDGFVFNEISQIEGAGNNIGLLNYSITDKSPLSGQSYYRLKQVDFDGTFTYSKIVSVIFEEVAKTCQVYPNPVQQGQELKIDFFQQSTGEVSYQVYDVLGKSILQKNIRSLEGQNTLYIPTNRLQQSHYFVRIITTDGAVSTLGFIVQ